MTAKKKTTKTAAKKAAAKKGAVKKKAPAKKAVSILDRVRAVLAKKPDATPEQIRKRVEKYGTVSDSWIYRLIRESRTVAS